MAGTAQRILNQYKSSPNLIALLFALVDSPALLVALAFSQLYERLDIDLSSGVQLDNIGTILNRPRPKSSTASPLILASQFTWDSTDTFKQWDAGVWDGGEDFPQMSDLEYRLLLKAVAYNQNNAPTVHNIEAFGLGVLGVPFLVTPYVGRVEVVAPYALSPMAVQLGKEGVRLAQGIALELYVGPQQGTGEVFQLDSADLSRGLDVGYWAIKV
ncbi:Protein of unknown function DUF2612 [uncultured Caudovirales phage]|uniref:Uncharacterized protein n=1 Tax=uncultured Caudovirales phage TaxID=2100421 RepID=A0A6J7X7C7_9CAUD|nr:Protein of unknown function DUF2612 [uncultured Caudovirales phage]